MESGRLHSGADISAVSDALMWTSGQINSSESAFKFARQAAKYFCLIQNSSAIHQFREGLESLEIDSLIKKYPGE